MPISMPVRRAALRASTALAWLALAGCAGLPDAPPPAPSATASEPPQPSVATPLPTPPPKPVPRPATPTPRDVVVLFEEGVIGYSDVATQIVEQLPAARYRVARVALRSADSPDLLASLVALRPSVIVTVGREATEFARTNLATTPLVFCQVFNYEDFLGNGQRVWGVSPLPPVALQLRGWTALDSSLRRIGMIVSDAHSKVVEEAIAAAGPTIEIKYAVSSSDRETLYLFKRLASQVDGFWLWPDNRILSPTVLRELLSYAIAHRIGVLVLNDALLPWGALLSATNTPADVARGVHSLVDRIASGTTKSLPPMTPLAEVKLRVNDEVASKLGLTAAPNAPWVLHASD